MLSSFFSIIITRIIIGTSIRMTIFLYHKNFMFCIINTEHYNFIIFENSRPYKYFLKINREQKT